MADEDKAAGSAGANGATGTGAGTAGSGASADKAQSGGSSDAGALNPDPGNQAGAETPKEAAKDPAKDPSVAGDKLFSGQNNPATAHDPVGFDARQSRAAIETTKHKVKGIDVTQPPALDLESGLARTTLFEKVQDDSKPDDSALDATKDITKE